MTREEAIKKIKEEMPTLWKETKEAIQVLIPELAESDDERIRKEMIRYFTEMKKGGSASLPYDDCIAYLESKGSGIKWFKSDNVKNPDKPYIDKAGMFYTTDGRMCPASEIEKQKEQKPVEINEYEIIKKHITEDVLSSEVNKRLKECGWYVTENPSQWSEEDEKVLNELLDYCNTENATWYNWLKSLRPQPKRKWTLSDEKLLGDVMVAVELDKFFTDEYQKKIVSWLRSLRPYPQSQWKPTDEQIGALNYAYCELFKREDVEHNILGPLQKLCDDLKKLR